MTSEHVPVKRGGYDPAGVDAVARAMYADWDRVNEGTREAMRGAARNVLDAYFAAAGSRQADALAILRELVAGADDYRCWWIPTEIDERARALLNAHPEETDD